jgi:predicted XRE-type DNA-binding protein
MRSAMMRALVAFIRKREQLTQTQAAKLLGVTLPRVSDLDNLVVLLAAAGLRVGLKIKKAP